MIMKSSVFLAAIRESRNAMQKRWFYSHNGEKVVGPCSSEELRKLTVTGQLSPDDMVRSGRMKRPARAGRVKGLFMSRLP